MPIKFHLTSSIVSLWQMIGGDRARFFPESCSSASHDLNGLTAYLLGISSFFTIGIFVTMTIFILKYRSRPGNEIAQSVRMNVKLEIAWALIPLVIALVAFAWGGKQFLLAMNPPQNAESIFVVGKQWMWKIEHENGTTEINELHVPFGRDVQLLMISQDVIHSFFIPDFRMKYDVLPGRYTRAWFHADKPGVFHFLCTQYCGTDHSRMIGTVYEMTDNDYHAWLENMKIGHGFNPIETSEQKGSHLFASKGCVSCHVTGSNMKDTLAPQKIGPSLAGVYGSVVHLKNHTAIVADENYLRESILNPHAKVVDGYQDVMPTYAGQMDEEEILDLVDFLRSLQGDPSVASKGATFNDQRK